jgi:acyl carrier protein
MDTETDVGAVVRGFLAEDVLPRPQAEALSSDDDLMASGILNSLTLTALVVFLEDRYEITVTPAEFELPTFRSLRSISTFVEAKRRAS